jgi:hypothetical protein
VSTSVGLRTWYSFVAMRVCGTKRTYLLYPQMSAVKGKNGQGELAAQRCLCEENPMLGARLGLSTYQRIALATPEFAWTVVGHLPCATKLLERHPHRTVLFHPTAHT